MRGLKLPALFAVVLLAQASQAQSPDWSRAQPVTVELSSFKFTPATLNLQHGTPYRIRFANSSSGGHDFVAKEFFDASTIAPEDSAKLHKGGVDVDGGESVEIRLVPNQAGSYKSHCSHFMHSSFGMTGEVIVR
jgi:plastocyanin